MRELVRYIQFKWEFDLQRLIFFTEKDVYLHCHEQKSLPLLKQDTCALPSVFYNLNSISIGLLNTLPTQ